MPELAAILCSVASAKLFGIHKKVLTEKMVQIKAHTELVDGSDDEDTVRQPDAFVRIFRGLFKKFFR